MSRPVKFRRQARKELDEAVDWYERKRLGLGEELRACVHEVLDRISKFPQLHSLAYKDIRRTMVRRFPYAVLYRVKRDRVVVIAVFHASRDPREWQRRV